MEEDYDDAFLLGSKLAWISKTFSLCGDHLKSERTQLLETIKQKYCRLQGLAKRFGIDLPNKPPEGRTDADEWINFISKQIDDVVACISRQESAYISDMFSTGQIVENYISLLFYRKYFNILEDSESEALKRLQKLANIKGIDISEEMNMATAWLENELESGNELKEQIDSQLMKKFGKRKQCEEKRSEIDQTRIITKDYWAISLVRLPDKSSEHAFLVIEGTSDNNTSKIWFADFVAKDPLDLFLAGNKDGKVRIDYHDSTQEPDASKKLLFRCDKQMMKIRRGDRFLYSTWQVPKRTAEKLVRILETLEVKPLKYNVLGNNMLALSSALSSSNQTGHNCFTFARMVLHELPDDYIKIPDDTLGKWTYYATSRYLGDEKRSDMLGFGSVLFFVAAVVTCAFLLKRLNF